MTQKQIDEKKYNYSTFVLDKFKDIQTQANTLKNVDRPKNEVAFAKITDFISDIRNALDKLEELDCEEPEPEEDTGGMSFFTVGSLDRRLCKY